MFLLTVFVVTALCCSVSFAAGARSDEATPSQESIGVEKQAGLDITKEGEMAEDDAEMKDPGMAGAGVTQEEKIDKKTTDNYEEAIDKLGDGPRSITRH